ncbi:MAG: transposase [Marinosulfonomonas sp.]|nr:transposase [Marinosulfonomonas sp.]
MGRSRGGLTTKIHALVNEDGLPLRYLLTPGQVVLADKAYDADWIREMIWEQGAKAVIPSKSNRKLPKEFDKALYKNRSKIERFFGRIKRSFRRIATRYDKTSRNFMAFINLATLRLWCQYYESAT